MEGRQRSRSTASWSAGDGSAKKLNDALQAIGENIKSNSVTFDTTQQDHTASLNNVAGSLNI